MPSRATRAKKPITRAVLIVACADPVQPARAASEIDRAELQWRGHAVQLRMEQKRFVPVVPPSTLGLQRGRVAGGDAPQIESGDGNAAASIDAVGCAETRYGVDTYAARSKLPARWRPP